MGYYDEARKRAQEKLKSPWTIPLRIVSFILILIFWNNLWKLIWQLHLLRYPGQHLADLGRTFTPIGMIIPLFFASIPIGLILGNYIAWLIPPVRKSLNTVADFRESQAGLLKFGRWVVFPSVAISLFFALI